MNTALIKTQAAKAYGFAWNTTKTMAKASFKWAVKDITLNPTTWLVTLACFVIMLGLGVRLISVVTGATAWVATVTFYSLVLASVWFLVRAIINK